MNIKTRIIATSCVIVLWFNNLSILAQTQQNPNLDFGNPTTEEMKMTSCSVEPNAPAVVLCKLDNVNYEIRDNDFCVVYDIKERIKILKPEGKDYANVSINYVDFQENPMNSEKISGLKAVAFNMTDGKIVKSKMDDKLVFRERLDKEDMLIKFTVPQVKVGTVIEYQYKIVSPLYYNIRNWYAQTSIPTMYSYYHLVVPEYFQFNMENTSIYKMEQKLNPIGCAFNYNGESLNCNGCEYKFTACNMPSIKEDGFVWHAKDYCNKVTAELNSIHFPGNYFQNYANEWKDIDKSLLDDDDFGHRMKKSNPFKNEMTAAKIYNLKGNTEKIVAIYQLLKKKLKWNGDYGFWGRSSRNILKDGSGDNADINFVLINMLNDAGVKAVPVVMSTRDNGRLPLTYPSRKFLNTFVVGAYTNDSTLVFIDSSIDDGYLNVLPAKLLTDRARIIEKNNCRWVNLQNIAQAKRDIRISAQLNPQGVLTGMVRCTSLNNLAARVRVDFKHAKDSATFVSQKAREEGIEITKYSISDRTSFSPSVCEDYSFSKNCEATADHIYVNPLVIIPINDNPFTETERKLPIEFPYKQTILLNVHMTIPEGYVVEEKCNGARIETPNKEISCHIKCLVDDKTSFVQYRLDINDTFFGVTDYNMVKDVYAKICEYSKNMLVLKKM
jgi:hypothetical protein